MKKYADVLILKLFSVMFLFIAVAMIFTGCSDILNRQNGSIIDNSAVNDMNSASSAPTGSFEPTPDTTTFSYNTEGVTYYTPYDPMIAPQEVNFICIYGNTAYEYYNYVESTAKRYADAVSRAADSVKDHGINVYDMVIPTSTDIVLNDEVRKDLPCSDQKNSISKIYSAMNSNVITVPVYDTLKAHNSEYLYYRTDHHWTALGAYYAYTELMRAKGADFKSLSDFEERKYPGFLGSFYWDTDRQECLGNEPDTLYAYVPECNYTFQKQASGEASMSSWPLVADASTYSSSNKYLCFIGGDNPLSLMENTDMPDGETCVLVKESFGNAFVPFLAYNYKYVYVIDYRYFSGDITDFAVSHNARDIIIQSNISMTRNSDLVTKLSQKL